MSLARGWDRRVVAAALAAGAVIVLGACGLVAASATRVQPPAPAQGRLTVAYEVRRAPRYAPPPPSEETRLDVRPPASLYTHAEVLSPPAEAAWTAMQADDGRRMAAALAEIRAADRRLDRDLAAQLRSVRYEDQAPAAFVEAVADEDPRGQR